MFSTRKKLILYTCALRIVDLLLHHFCSPLSILYFSLRAASRVAVDILPLDVERL